MCFKNSTTLACCSSSTLVDSAEYIRSHSCLDVPLFLQCYVCVHKISLFQTHVRCWMVNLFWICFCSWPFVLMGLNKAHDAMRVICEFQKVLSLSLYPKKVGVNIFFKKEIMEIIFLRQIPNLSLQWKLGKRRGI